MNILFFDVLGSYIRHDLMTSIAKMGNRVVNLNRKAVSFDHDENLESELDK